MSPEPLNMVPSEIQKELRNIFPGSDINPVERNNLFSIRDNAYAGTAFPVEFIITMDGVVTRCMYKLEGDYSDRVKGHEIQVPRILLNSEFVKDSALCEIPENALDLGAFVVGSSISGEISLAGQLQRAADRFLDENPDLKEAVSARFPNRHCAFIFVPNSHKLTFIL